MKIGEKVYCIKTHAKTPIERKNINLYEGKFYTISEIYPNSVNVNEKIFKLTKNKKETYLYFDDYFLTEKNARRYKLNKINESRG